jgi:hypothetical protein
MTVVCPVKLRVFPVVLCVMIDIEYTSISKNFFPTFNARPL